jgi:hypothetical protein
MASVSEGAGYPSELYLLSQPFEGGEDCLWKDMNGYNLCKTGSCVCFDLQCRREYASFDLEGIGICIRKE